MRQREYNHVIWDSWQAIIDFRSYSFSGENSHFVKVTPPLPTKGKEETLERWGELTFNEPFNRSGSRCNATVLSFSSAFRRACLRDNADGSTTTPLRRRFIVLSHSSTQEFYFFSFEYRLNRWRFRICGWRNRKNVRVFFSFFFLRSCTQKHDETTRLVLFARSFRIGFTSPGESNIFWIILKYL